MALDPGPHACDAAAGAMNALGSSGNAATIMAVTTPSRIHDEAIPVFRFDTVSPLSVRSPAAPLAKSDELLRCWRPRDKCTLIPAKGQLQSESRWNRR